MFKRSECGKRANGELESVVDDCDDSYSKANYQILIPP